MTSRLGIGFSYRLASRAAWGSLTGAGVVFFFDKMFLVSTRQEGRERLAALSGILPSMSRWSKSTPRAPCDQQIVAFGILGSRNHH